MISRQTVLIFAAAAGITTVAGTIPADDPPTLWGEQKECKLERCNANDVTDCSQWALDGHSNTCGGTQFDPNDPNRTWTHYKKVVYQYNQCVANPDKDCKVCDPDPDEDGVLDWTPCPHEICSRLDLYTNGTCSTVACSSYVRFPKCLGSRDRGM